MFLVLQEIQADLDTQYKELFYVAANTLGINKDRILDLTILKQSVDARRKQKVHFVYTLFVQIEGRMQIKNSKISEFLPEQDAIIHNGSEKLKGRVVVVGAGPAGLFAALTLAQKGYNPLLIERGCSVEERVKKVQRYWDTGVLDTESNVQFGEGGAGTFSDGKLTTRIHDKRCGKVIDFLVEAGAPKEIKYKAKAHIGTDKLREILPTIRQKITFLGGEIRYTTKLSDIIVIDGRVSSVKLSNGEQIETGAVVLAIGHSARDTFEMLFEKGVYMEQKAFSVGARIEHPQGWLDEAQYGPFAGHPALGAADYQLFDKNQDRTAYTFCMCPGGVVVPSASERDTIVTNGMSYYDRAGSNANSAFVVSVGPADFQSNHPLDGVNFQRQIEELAFKQNRGAAPIQRLEDFMKGRISTSTGVVKPTYLGRFDFGRIDMLLPENVVHSMRKAVVKFENKLKGFHLPDALLTAPETRTSSPLRITRNETGQSLKMDDLYPAGEGAGYAGGIVSAAVDGIRVAEKIISRFATT